MTNLHAAINHYHDLCTTGTLAQQSWEMLLPGLRDRNLIFGQRPLCTVLRPMFHTPESYRYLTERTALTLSVFRKATAALLADPQLRAQLFLDQMEEELISLPTGYSTNIPTARLDSFFTRHLDGGYTLNFIEFNGESPAGMAYNDVMAELFLELPLMQRFQERYKVQTLEVRPHAVEALLRIYYQWRGNHDKLPDIAIVDFRGVPTTTEFKLFADYFAQHGIKSVICDPDEMEFRNGQMYAAGQPVDFVYKRVLASELVQKYGLNHPIIDAVRAGAVCMANPFNCKLLHKKASFAFVSDERNAYLFNAEELDAVRQHIPWTRMVEERKTIGPDGATLDLVPWISANKEQLVLKPNDEYGGKGVLIGWETEQAVWDNALQTALHEPSIVQVRATIAYEDFPRIDDQGKLDISQRLVDCDPFLFHGDSVGGCLTRLSTVTLLNVTAGGGSAAPAFLLTS
ncbi:MAG: circularly permuted type 2 ATP-grasp protein [Caldilineaceae bacterium]